MKSAEKYERKKSLRGGTNRENKEKEKKKEKKKTKKKKEEEEEENYIDTDCEQSFVTLKSVLVLVWFLVLQSFFEYSAL